MNRMLAEALSILNVLISLMIALVGTIVGWRLFGTAIGALSGLFVGVVFAALTGGIIAYLALIERHLAKIAGGRDIHVREGESPRVDPTL